MSIKAVRTFVLLALAILAVTGMAYAQASSSHPAPIRSRGVVMPELSTNSNYVPGLPAIQPTKRVASQAEAAFAEADVRQYLANHPLFKPATPTGGAVTKVLFITAAQASAMLRGESIGRPDDTLVCLVEVQGPLDMSGVSVPAGIPMDQSKFKPAQTGVIVFDAQTGNLLITGYTA